MTTRGRPRRADIDASILDATRALLVGVGYGGLTMEAVAARAGVGKPTVCRRYPTKAVLVFEAVLGKTKKLVDPNTGVLRDDLIETYSWAVEEFAAPEAKAALPGLMADVGGGPELATLVRATVIEPEYARVREFERAQRRGEVRDDVDLELVTDTFTGTAFARASLLDHELDHAFGVALVDLILDGAEAPRLSGRFLSTRDRSDRMAAWPRSTCTPTTSSRNPGSIRERRR